MTLEILTGCLDFRHPEICVDKPLEPRNTESSFGLQFLTAHTDKICVNYAKQYL